MLKMVPLMRLEEEAQKRLSEFLHNVDNTQIVWMDEVLEEAIKMFSSNSNEEPCLMPKTPSQKNRQKKKRFSSAKQDQFAKKRLSKRNDNQSSPRLQCKRDLDLTKGDTENISPCYRVTRSLAARLARPSDKTLKTVTIDLAKGRIPLVEISAKDRNSAELQLTNTPPPKEQVALSITSDESSSKRSQLVSKASLSLIPETPEAQIIKNGQGASKMKIANMSIAETTENEKQITQEETVCVQQQANWQQANSETEDMQNLSEHQTPRAPKANRQSVRRSLMGRPSLNCKTSLAKRCSLRVKREIMAQNSVAKTLSKSRASQRSSAGCQRASLGSSEKSEELQKPSKNVGRQASYKRALGDTEDEQCTEDKVSPPRKKAPSPYLASKVVRPFKTFLHTVHKNQMLMTTPGSVSRNSTIKSFLKQNTPLRTTPQEKQRQRFENLRKKEEAEQFRKQKLEEEKCRRQEEMRRKREERFRKVLQAREQVEQKEEEKKKRLEQKLVQHEEKNEKVREEKIAEDKAKKKVAAKKLEEIEARRKQEDEARKQKALQLEEDERRHRELMQKRKEEEQEKARKIAEQHRAELEKEKNLAAERELEKKREQERLQAQWEHEQQEKEKAARLKREVLAAAKEKEHLRKEMEEKERELQEQQKLEEQEKADAKAANKQLNVTVDIENLPACNSYEMTPKSYKQPKIELTDYGMDLNSDDSTDDESQPRKPIPAWATGKQLTQAVIHQYFNPPNLRTLFGAVASPKLEEIFYKSKPRYFKRTSSAVWNSPPFPKSALKRW